ncbi:hypothetical protein VB734_05325 [Synechococcus sp. BA-124 BA4]|jgi:hypothetical protein|uniref:hypothetical protein n=1 Tax=Synechococcus sp. BA-124 BA4 TaxID=3110251 RepID=UPI002B20B620|nr:hypothetical protein [Synechococcus sp. BA-124 BA4]MEA5399459.1 hypothetical protein [Synechococcus sp. BA-124 BA4]MEA5410608.1 hypothetical protein [Synechococcus sp. BA-120 BA3]
MIHITVAAPMGIDSVFFSFIERLAMVNGHACVDPPAQQLDDVEPREWIDEMIRSTKHYFLIGYRYPPLYWKTLVEQAGTVCLLADPNGVARQVEQIRLKQLDSGLDLDTSASIQLVRHAIDASIELAEWSFADDRSSRWIVAPAASFLRHPREGFTRLEHFYRNAGVAIPESCANQFSEEALPHLNSGYSPAHETVSEIRKLLTMGNATPRRLQAVSALFYDYG